MSIFDFDDKDAFGKVQSVDTSVVVIKVDDIERLRRLQVNRLVVMQTSRAIHHLVGVIQKITRTPLTSKASEGSDEVVEDGDVYENNIVRVALIGTFLDRRGDESNVFIRTLETVSEIDANCFALEGERLSAFMRVISSRGKSDVETGLKLGRYTIDDNAEAYLDGNKFFQRHALVVGSTGSGKSWAIANLLEQVASLDNPNAIIFDIHGEYGSLAGDGIKHLRVAGPADVGKKLSDGVVHLPYWLLGYEAMLAMFVDRSDQNAPNQSMIMSRTIVECKKKYLIEKVADDLSVNFTIDSPIPFDITILISKLTEMNEEMVPGKTSQKQGDYFGKLSRMISRLENKKNDRRLGFLFNAGEEVFELGWLNKLVALLLGGSVDQEDSMGGVKVVDFSDVPSDVLPLIISMMARLAFSVQQWTPREKRHPVALVCDEAHLYIPEKYNSGGADDISVGIFERISKEGRKYGVGLLIVSQRPSEVNRTVLSQCNNIVSLRLTNAEDQSVIRRLLPDSLGGFGDLLPVLDVGEALVVGDSSLLPSRIRINEPKNRPNSASVDFWDRWRDNQVIGSSGQAVENWRKQSM